MEQIQPVVNQDELTTPPVNEDAKMPQDGSLPEGLPKTPAIQPGDKTNSALLLESLQEEREKRRKLEIELESIKNTSAFSEEEVFSEEGKALKKQIDSLQFQLKERDERESLNAVYAKYPLLRDKASEFNELRKQYPLVEIESIAKLFISENGLLEPKRKGLERPTGGDRNPAPSGMSASDVENLRKNSPKKYRDMLKKGQIKIAE